MSYALGSIIERFIEAVKRSAKELYIRGVSKISANVNKFSSEMALGEESISRSIITAVIKLHTTISKEDVVIRSFKTMGSAIQKLQCSLEDSLSILSLLLEFLSVLSIILIMVIAWLS